MAGDPITMLSLGDGPAQYRIEVRGWSPPPAPPTGGRLQFPRVSSPSPASGHGVLDTWHVWLQLAQTLLLLPGCLARVSQY